MYNNKVPASIINDTYEAKVNFSKQVMITAKFSYRAGSIFSERVTYVYILLKNSCATTALRYDGI